MNAIAPSHLSARSRHPSSSIPHPLQRLDAVAIISSCGPRQELCREGQPASTIYRVIAGAALRSVIRPDGRRQVVDLLFPGDFFGLTAGADYDNTVESAARGTIVAGYPRKRAEAQADSDPKFARELRQIAFDELSRLQEQLLILGRITVPEKVGSFIVAVAHRLSPGCGDRVTLPISRYDIADYLAVSAETVSRSLSELQRRGVIRLTGTRVLQILDREALEEHDHHDWLSSLPSRRAPAQLPPASCASTPSRTASAN